MAKEKTDLEKLEGELKTQKALWKALEYRAMEITENRNRTTKDVLELKILAAQIGNLEPYIKFLESKIETLKENTPHTEIALADIYTATAALLEIGGAEAAPDTDHDAINS